MEQNKTKSSQDGKKKILLLPHAFQIAQSKSYNLVFVSQ